MLSNAPLHPCMHTKPAVPPDAPWSYGCKPPCLETSLPISTHLLWEHIWAYASMLLHQVFAPRHSIFLQFLGYRGNSALPSDRLTMQVSHISASTRKMSFCHHWASIQRWIPSAQVLYLKKTYQFSALDDNCLLQDDIVSSEDWLTSINTRYVLPSLPKWLTAGSWQQWALLVFDQASWVYQKEAIEALDCGPQRGWGMLRGTYWLQSPAEHKGVRECSKYRSKLAVSSPQN